MKVGWFLSMQIPSVPQRIDFKTYSGFTDGVTRHREGGTHLVGHGRGEVEVVRVVGGDSDLDAARPLLDEAVDPDLEELAVLERAVRHRHAVVELVVRPPALGGPAVGFRSKKDPQLGSYMYTFHLENTTRKWRWSNSFPFEYGREI